MSSFQLFITGILALLSFHLVAQQKDSIVSIHSVDYEADTVQSSYTHIIRYQKGKEVSDLMVEYWGTDNWRDSVTVLTTYDANGKRLLKTTRKVAPDECHQKEQTTQPVWSHFPVLLEDSVPKSVYTSPVQCRIHYYDTTVFFDTMEVKNTFYEDQDSEIYSVDTVFYYPNHRMKAEVKYLDGKLTYRKNYRYVYDQQGRPVQIFMKINDRNTFTSVESHQVYNDSTPNETYQKFIYDNDSLNFRSIERNYNKQFKQISYTIFQNGAFFGSGTNRFSDDGHMLEANTYNADSSLRDHHEYRWKISRNTTEHWMSQNYQHNTELNGFSYARYDTLRTPETLEIRCSGKRIGKPKDRFKSYKAKDCIPSQVIIYDKQNRLLEVRNFDYETGKVSSVMTYTYSN